MNDNSKAAPGISKCIEWTDEKHGFYIQIIRKGPGNKEVNILQFNMHFHPSSLKSEWERRFYLEERKKTKKGADTTSCRVRHSRKTKASPPSTICPILRAQDTSVITMAFDWDPVHSITERNTIEVVMLDEEISRSNLRFGKWEKSKLSTYWAYCYLIWWPQQNSLTRSVGSSKWGRWGQRLHTSPRWQAGANSTWGSICAQT